MHILGSVNYFIILLLGKLETFVILESVRQLIRDYPDFPSKGIVFKDILPLLSSPKEFKYIIQKMADNEILYNSDAIVSIDARGFIFGTALSSELSKPIILARKPGKLPGELITKSYNLEYGSNSLSIQKDSIQKFKSFAIVDDLLATGGTVSCVSEILYEANKEVTGLSVFIELRKLNGRKNFDFDVNSQLIF